MSPYAVTKLATEQYTLCYQQSYGMDTLAFRFFNVYGPRQRAGHVYAAVIPVFLDALMRGEALPINGDGSNSRDFTYVGTVCKVLLDAAERRVTHPEPVNLAFGTNTTLLELVSRIEHAAGTTAEVVHRDPRAGDVKHSQADNAEPAGPLPGRVARVPRRGPGRDRHLVQGDLMSTTLVVVGQGYVGLPMALRAAEVGLKVHGLDTNSATVVGAQRRRLPHRRRQRRRPRRRDRQRLRGHRRPRLHRQCRRRRRLRAHAPRGRGRSRPRARSRRPPAVIGEHLSPRHARHPRVDDLPRHDRGDLRPARDAWALRRRQRRLHRLLARAHRPRQRRPTACATRPRSSAA